MDKDRIRVIVVDDEPDVAELTAEFLESNGETFDVEYETRAEVGLDRLATGDFDCVVSDYDMPEMDGLEFLELVREESGDLPFILFTGKGSEEIASEAITRGVTEYMQKEVGLDQYAVLANRVENAVAQARAEERIERERRRFQLLVEEATDVIFITDASGTVTYASPSAERVLGRSPADIEGTNGFEFIHPDDIEGIQRELSHLLENDQSRSTIRFRYERPDGEWIWIEARGRNLLDDPIVGGIVAYARDVTEQVVMEGEPKPQS